MSFNGVKNGFLVFELFHFEILKNDAHERTNEQNTYMIVRYFRRYTRLKTIYISISDLVMHVVHTTLIDYYWFILIFIYNEYFHQ